MSFVLRRTFEVSPQPEMKPVKKIIMATQPASALRFFSMSRPPATPAPAVCRLSYVVRIHSRPRSLPTKKQLPKSRQVPHPRAAGCCKSLLLGRLLGGAHSAFAFNLAGTDPSKENRAEDAMPGRLHVPQGQVPQKPSRVLRSEPSTRPSPVMSAGPPLAAQLASRKLRSAPSTRPLPSRSAGHSGHSS